MKHRGFFSTVIWTAGMLALPLAASAAQSAGTGPETGPAIHSDVSRPLRDVVSAPRDHTPKLHPNRRVPLPAQPEQADAALQTAVGPTIASTGGLRYPGVGAGDYGFNPNSAPPDPNLSVGSTQVVQIVNESFAVFDKATGAIAAGFPKTNKTLWSGFGGGCEANNDGDAIVQYDKAANRWVITQFSVTTTPYLQCVAVSTTSDATGSYNRYAFSYGTTQFNDYAKLSVWPSAYFITFNIFTNGSTFAGAKACAYDRASMLNGAPATQQCFQLSTSYGGLLPSDLDGTIAPPAGSPAYFVNFGTNSLNLWRFRVDWATPANTTFTGPASIPVAAFTSACGGGACIPQPGTSQKLDSLADRLMYRLAYRRFADGHEAMVVNHSVKVSGTKRAEVDGIRWYEIRSPGTTPTIFQQGTFSPDATNRWMGSIAMDKLGNIAVGYSASSGSVYPSLRFTGRVPSDPLGTLQNENVILPGGGSQLTNLSRWGDYSALAVDPSDDCTFFYTNEYLKTNGTFNWSTEIASFKLPGC